MECRISYSPYPRQQYIKYGTCNQSCSSPVYLIYNIDDRVIEFLTACWLHPNSFAISFNEFILIKYHTEPVEDGKMTSKGDAAEMEDGKDVAIEEKGKLLSYTNMLLIPITNRLSLFHISFTNIKTWWAVLTSSCHWPQ